MANDWINTTIGEQLLLQRGFDITKIHQREGTIPVVSTAGVLSFHDTAMASGPGVVLGRKGNGIGRAHYVPMDYWPHDTTLWVKDFKGNHPRFVYYFFLQMLRTLQALDVGSANPTLNRNHVHPIPVQWPSVTNQKDIASVLSALDDKIELNRRMNATLEGMARALFQSWFVDFDPVRAKQAGHTPANLDPATAALFPNDFESSPIGQIPRGWKVVSIPDAIDFLEGPGLRNWQYRDEGMKFLNIRCIGAGDLDIAKANCIGLEEFEKTYSHFALRTDDIVISTSGTLGRLAIVRPDHLPIMLNTSIIRMRGRETIGLGYLWGFLQSEYFLSEMFALAAGSVQLNFGPMHLRKIAMLRPPDSILQEFESSAQPLLKQALHFRKESRTLAALRDTLLPKLLSGELSVAAAEDVVDASR